MEGWVRGENLLVLRLISTDLNEVLVLFCLIMFCYNKLKFKRQNIQSELVHFDYFSVKRIIEKKLYVKLQKWSHPCHFHKHTKKLKLNKVMEVWLLSFTFFGCFQSGLISN